MADQSRASAPISMSSSMWRVGLRTVPGDGVSGRFEGVKEGGNQGRERGRCFSPWDNKEIIWLWGWGILLTSRSELVLKANIKSRVGVRSKCHSRLAGNILGSAVFIAYGVLDLFGSPINGLADAKIPELVGDRRGEGKEGQYERAC